MSLQIPLTHIDDLYNDSLIAHYTMNANGNDSTSNGNHLSGSPGLTFSNNTTTPGPPYRASSALNPGNGYWGRASVTGLTEPYTTGFTVAYWMFPQQGSEVHCPVSFGNGSTSGAGLPTSDTFSGRRYTCDFHPPNLWHYIQFTGGQIGIKNTSTVSQWTHVVMTIDSNNVCNLYQNGSLSGTITGSGRLYGNWDTVTVGANPYHGTYSNQTGFYGLTADVRIYNTVLTSTHVTSLYTYTQLNATFPTTSTNVTIPTNNWNFLVSGAVGDIIYDNISNDTATYESGFTSDATNGATSNINTARLRIATGSLSFQSSFSFEMLVRINNSQAYHQLFFSHSGGNLNGTGLYFGSSSSNKLKFFVANGSGNLFTSDSTGTYTGSALSMDGSTFYHIVCVLDGANDSAYIYQDGAKVWEQTSLSLSESDFPITPSTFLAIGREQQSTNINIKNFRVWENYALTETNVGALYRNTSADVFLFSNLRLHLGDVHLAQTLNKTLADYRTENIPLNDVSFATLSINKFKETYILGDVDISGDTILRSNNTYFTDISADTFDVSGNLLISDLSANSRLFVGDDVSFNSNVTIQGDLSLGADISFNAIFTRALAGIGTGAGLPMNTDFSMNANLEINGGTTIKNDLHFNAYSDVSANPVLTDGTLLHNQKMEKLDHRYLLDISRSSPFSTLNYNTLPSNIYDNSTNSGICISGDGKYIRTVNSSDVSANALSYYSEDYGSSFQEDKDLSTKLSQFDLSINSLDDYNDYHVIKIPGATYTNEPVGTTGLWTTGGTTSSSFTHSSGTYTINSDTTLDNSTGTMYDVWRLFGISTGSSTAWGHAMNRTGWSVSSGNIRRHGSKSLTAYDAANSATTYNGDYITITTPYSFLMTQIGFANHWAGNTVNKFMVIGEDSTGTNRVLLAETTHGQGIGSFTTFTVSTTYIVNKFYIHITEINSLNQFTGIRKLRWNGVQADTIIQSFIPKFGSDKVFMSYNGQHQLVPKGVSNKLTYDDFLYVSNNFGKNWNLRKNNTISTTTYSYTVTANGSSNYILNGGGFSSEAQPVVHIYLNESTEFTIDSTTNGNHPFKIGTSENGGEITDSTITSVTSGSNQVITFKPTNSGTFYYYCSSHTGMGSSINVVEPAGRFNLDASGSSWFWNTAAVSADGKHMYISGKTGLWKSQDFGTSWYQASADSSFNYMSISADGKQVYGVNERKVYGSSDYGNTFSTLYSDSYTSDLSYAGISTSGNGKYITIADISGSNIYMSSNYGNSFELKPVDNYTNFVSLTAAYSWDFRVATPSDNIVKDSIGGLNATYVSGVTSSVADGAYFSGGGTSNGSSPYINLDAFPAGGGYSFETYVKFDATDKFARIFDFGNTSGSGTLNYYLGRSGENSTFFFRANEGSPITPGTIVNGVLTHIVAIFSSSGAFSLYQDGALIGTSSGSTTTTVQTRSNNYLGRSNWSVDDAFSGNIHFFRVYASELSSSDITKLYTNREVVITNINCGMSHSGKIVLNSDFISYDYGNNFHYIPSLISNQLTNNDTFYSKANMEYLLDPSNNLMLSIPYKSAQFQDIYSVGSIKVGTTTYSSDYRIKENVEELGEQDTLNELRPVKYYNTNLERNDYGLIAHELQEKYPFLVSGEKDGPEPQSINYNGLISLLVHEIKNLKKEYLELQEMKK